MRKKHKIIAGIGVALAIGTGAITIPTNPAPLTPTEWNSVSSMYNYEIKQMGKINLKNIRSDNVLSVLNSRIKARKVTKPVKVNGKEMLAKDYETLRSNLIDRVERRSLLQRLIQ